ncbi:MAG: penicillin acylase family protein [Deferribacteres bacterium]|nr:penicillin acylase family protein [candidate division KSB1 bacterium]MCB9504431.1 penicillin acylase family protein [Deferribacteres bacterium]
MSEKNAKSKSKKSPVFKWIMRIVLLVLILVIIAGFYAYHKVTQSLPLFEGELALSGITTPVSIERDDFGIATIRGNNRVDMAFATGFLHAQERFFQMDLLRRRGAGELAELFGAAALPIDHEARIHRFRARSEKYLEAMDEEHRNLLTAYKDGVNAGLAELGTAPFEYLLIGTEPAQWRDADTYLCVMAMYFTLQSSDGNGESNLGLMHDLLPPSLFEFLAPKGTKWDAAIDGTTYPKPPLPQPGNYFDNQPSTASIQTVPASDFERMFPGLTEDLFGAVGSNNWVVSGDHTENGAALVCNDMHLSITIPNTWYRLTLIMEGENARNITGVSLPGAPFIVTGSNSNVAWGFTNSYGDWSDLIILETDTNDPNHYKTPDGLQPFSTYDEIIKIKGAAEDTMHIEETIWGPVIDQDYLGRKRAYRWVAHSEKGVNVNLYDLETAGNVNEALEIAHRSGIPAQNFVTGDRYGNIGWTIAGPIPRRKGEAGRYPQSWADGKNGWDGWLTAAECPKVVNPPSGRIWSANARVVGGQMGDKLYDYYNFTMGARCQQIRDNLMAKEKFVPADMIKIQRDNRAVFYEPWQKLLLEILDEEALKDQPNRQDFRKEVENWGAMAVPGSVGFRLVKNFRHTLARALFDPMLAHLKQKDNRFSYISKIMAHHEQAMWDLVTQKPDYLLAPGFSSWQDLFLAQVDSVISATGTPLSAHPWGEENTFKIQHPFSPSIPAFSKWLDIPAQALPGEMHMPFMQTKRGNGLISASERFAVTPGRENEAYMHMPTGPSGHPLSPFYNKGHEAWVNGELTPFLPGESKYELRLVPN